MAGIYLKVFGIPIFEIGIPGAVEDAARTAELSDAVALALQANAEELTEWNGSTNTNGSFERDTEPLRADRMEPYYEDRTEPFGFSTR